jgi:hypothetical protein
MRAFRSLLVATAGSVIAASSPAIDHRITVKDRLELCLPQAGDPLAAANVTLMNNPIRGQYANGLVSKPLGCFLRIQVGVRGIFDVILPPKPMRPNEHAEFTIDDDKNSVSIICEPSGDLSVDVTNSGINEGACPSSGDTPPSSKREPEIDI